MNNKEIIEGNKIIGEFMNWDKWTPCDYTCDCDGSPFPLHSFCKTDFGITAKYHTSWDWLMPVVVKINNLGFRVEINHNSTLIYEDVRLDKIINNPYGYGEQNNWIEITWQAVIDFIKWYNEINSKFIDVIKVPDSIKFVQLAEKIYLVSPNKKLMMSVGAYKDRPSITFVQESSYSPDIPNYAKDLYLIPCKKEDLKPGDLAYKTNINNTNFITYDNYCVILKDNYYSKFTFPMNILTQNLNNSFWYKIVKKSEL